ncbi:Hypothetical_protein [Hexamita inflata]|uniref:Hypothetical_protein n=1 Tax=Hexamita inflata TaxID=28002 RepID=A0ABP1JA29_9EUKA
MILSLPNQKAFVGSKRASCSKCGMFILSSILLSLSAYSFFQFTASASFKPRSVQVKNYVLGVNLTQAATATFILKLSGLFSSVQNQIDISIPTQNAGFNLVYAIGVKPNADQITVSYVTLLKMQQGSGMQFRFYAEAGQLTYNKILTVFAIFSLFCVGGLFCWFVMREWLHEILKTESGVRVYFE